MAAMSNLLHNAFKFTHPHTHHCQYLRYTTLPVQKIGPTRLNTEWGLISGTLRM